MLERTSCITIITNLLAAYSLLIVSHTGNAQSAATHDTSVKKGGDHPGQPELLPYETPFRISRVIALPNEDSRVLINAGTDKGISEGYVYDIMRPTKGLSNQPIWVKTGAIKIVTSNDQYALGQIQEQGTSASYGFFPKFPAIMAGDTLFEPKVTIVQKRLISPTKSLPYARIFIDPKAYPTTFELSEEGKKLLHELAAYYYNLKAPLLMVEGYTDDSGPADVNQVESYQRALTVRQFLIEDAGFDAARVVALGFGKAELDQNTHVPGKSDALRRIAFKVNSAASPLQ